MRMDSLLSVAVLLILGSCGAQLDQRSDPNDEDVTSIERRPPSCEAPESGCCVVAACIPPYDAGGTSVSCTGTTPNACHTVPNGVSCDGVITGCTFRCPDPPGGSCSNCDPETECCNALICGTFHCYVKSPDGQHCV